MKPGMRMMMLDKMREPQSRSEYGNDPTRRMIGYDRQQNYDRRRPEMEPREYSPMDAEHGYPPVVAPMHERGYPPTGMMPAERGGYNPRGMAPADWDYAAPAEMYGTDRMAYGGTEMRRRRDRRGRYMMADDMEPDDEDDDKYRLKGGSKMVAKGAIWTEGEEDDDWCEKLKRKSFKPVDEHQAMEWVSEMSTDNGKPMPVFSITDTENQRKVMCPDCEKWEFFVAMNAMYADYQPLGVKYGAGEKPEFYAMAAKLFLQDKDAGKHKLQKYMMVIPK